MLVLKRLYIRDDLNDIVTLATSSVSVAEARRKLAEIAAFPERQGNDDEALHGEMWFDVEDEEGNITDETVAFAAEHAQAVLERTGMSAERAAQLLSDEHACAELAAYYRDLGMPARAAYYDG